MALRVIAQLAPGATTLTTLVDGKQVSPIHLQSLVVCNRAAASATFRMTIQPTNEALDNKHYLFYDLPIVPNDSFTSSLDIGVQPGDVIKVYASTANLTFTVFGDDT